MSGWMKVGCLVLLAVMGLAAGLPGGAEAVEALAGEAQAAAEAKAAALAGRLINIEGEVTVRPAGSEQWTPARPNQELYMGDGVQTGVASRAAILSLDESQIKLNENTVLILKQVALSPRLRLGEMVPAAEAAPQSTYQVPQGEIWLRNKYEKFRFELETPAVTAALRGTELNVRVRRDGATSVILLDGKILLTNPKGEVVLSPGEEGRAVPGQAPTKHVLVRPLDAVQWSLYYPGIFSYRDLPFSLAPASSSALAALIQQGEAAYNRGDLAAAKSAAQEALRQNPDNPRALTLLGWVALQEFAPREAQGYFQRVRQPDEMALIGLGLARYRLGNPTGAYALVTRARQQVRPGWLLTAMSGYFALMVGKVEEARGLLNAAAAERPDAALPRAFLAQIELAQNRKDTARALASQALAQAPASPLANLTLGLVDLATFDLKAAQLRLEKAIELDPRFVDAYVYLAKLWLGSEYLARAQKTIERALALDPRDADVLSLAGFIRLAYRDYPGAQRLFAQASQADPALGEPHIGQAICLFRYRDPKQGLAEMLTATLLDPRLAPYQTELGKALYQTRAFNKALDVYDYAKTLDPKDPTPYFYKGLALTDLNRPGEAIQEINRSIALNDNVAMFRSRSLLDQDLAVRNASLARSYQQLGLTDWAFSKAVTAVKYYPTNSSAHLFLRDVIDASRSGAAAPFLTSGLLFAAAETEGALYRVLSPANQATYSNLQLRGTEALGLTREYTPMFEMPYVSGGVSAGVGASEGGNLLQHHQVFAYGGRPGLAFETFGEYFDDQGRPRPSDSTTIRSFGGINRIYNVEGNVKWEPTVQGTFTGLVQYIDQKVTDSGTGTAPPSTPSFGFADTINIRSPIYEAAYYYRFNPQAAFLAYFAHRTQPFHAMSQFFDLPISFKTLESLTFDQESNNVQLQQHLKFSLLGQHTLIGGFEYFSAIVNQSDRRDLVIPFNFRLLQASDRPPFWSYNLYLQDYWRPFQDLVLELALFRTWQKDTRGFPGEMYRTLWSPRFGANYQFSIGSTQHVLRAMAERHLSSHPFIQSLLVPMEIAGFPWLIDASSGSEVRQAGAAWEAQWDNKTFTALRFNALRVSTPNFFNEDSGIPGPRIWQTWRRYQGSLVLNRILTTSLGLSVGISGKRVFPDSSFEPSLSDFSEIDAFLSLAYLHRDGWLARLTPLLVQQFGKIPGHEQTSPFVIMNATLGKEFANKRGFALFDIQNIFNRQPFYLLEPRRDLEFPTDRRFLVRLGFYF